MHIRTRLVATLMAASLVAACGSSGGSSGATTTASTAPPAAETTAAPETTTPAETAAPTTDASVPDTEAPTTSIEPASGEPITIGFVHMEDGPLAQPAMGDAAEAARLYVNEKLGGINGRPLEFDKCVTTGAPDASAVCANDLVAAKVPVVLQGFDYGNAALHPILSDAGIPWVGQEPFTPQDYQDGFFFSGSQVAYGLGAGIYLRDNVKPERVTILSYSTATAAASNEAYLKPAMEASGASVEIVTADYGAPDMSVAVAAALATNPDVIIFFMADADCTKIITAADQLGYEGMIIAGTCGAYVTDAGAAAEGVYTMAATYSVDDLTKASERGAADVAAYEEAMGEHAPDRHLDVFTQFVFAGVVNLARVMSGIDGEITSESVAAALEATVDEPSFMAGTFGCSGVLTELALSVCSADVLMLEARGGKLHQVSDDFIHGPSLFE